MQTVEEFLREYFRARTEWDRAIGNLYVPIAKQFLSPNFAIFDSEKSVKNSEAETILSCETSEGTTRVITNGCFGGQYRLRYSLSTSGMKWHIDNLELECGLCRGSGKRKDRESECRLCKGKGWKAFGEHRNI
jgi:hypothetical protein